MSFSNEIAMESSAQARQLHEGANAPQDTWETWARAEKLPDGYWYLVFGAPVLMLVLMWVGLCCKHPSQQNDADPTVASTRRASLLTSDGMSDEQRLTKLRNDRFSKTFELPFVVGWMMIVVCLFAITYASEAELSFSSDLWRSLFVKFLIMVCVSVGCGLFCRLHVDLDERGYVIGVKEGCFRVMYTRKVQQFVAYALPVVNAETALTACWSDMAVLGCYILTVKPCRECLTFFMLQFNCYDCLEDRPHSLKSAVFDDVIPGMIVILVFYHAMVFFNLTAHGRSCTNFALLFVLMTGLTSFLKTPVHNSFGKHIYIVRNFIGSRKQARKESMEGSCCVAWLACLCVAWKWYLFPNATAFWLTMLLLPPLFALSDAHAPHSMDIPCSLAVGAFWCSAMLFVPSLTFLESSR